MIFSENRFPLFRIMLYSQAHTSMTLAAQATRSATVSVSLIRSQKVCSVVPMPAIFRRFYPESPEDSFFRDSGLVKDSGTPEKRTKNDRFSPHPPVKVRKPGRLKLQLIPGVKWLYWSRAMPYALFCNDAKLSKAYPTEADVWKEATRSGLVVDTGSAGKMPAPCPMLDNDYEIRPCPPDPDEDPARNKADAERQALAELELGS
jgi:hypothetical protein